MQDQPVLPLDSSGVLRRAPASLSPRARLRSGLKRTIVPFISRCWVAWYRLHLGKRVQFGRNFWTNGRLVIRGPGQVVFGDDINAWCHAEKNVLITYDRDARIEIGSGTRLNGAGVMAHTTIRVGPRCILGSTVIFDSDSHPLDPALRHTTEGVISRPIEIGANVWLGGQSAVLKGSSIGENSVVAFRAVVVGEVPPNVVVAGNPARVVKQLA